MSKEALTQPEQEPVAYLCENAVGHKYFRWKKPSSTYKPIALYTTPPQRTDATAKDADRAYELLRRAEVEMRYAGWTKYESDNSARNGVYEQIKEFLK